jgi:tetratricopeptide (TPR) repeat protein
LKGGGPVRRSRSLIPRISSAAVLLGVVAWALSACDERTNQPSSAAESSLSQEQIDASIDAAGRYFDNEENEKAEAILLALLQRDPGNPDAHELLASIEIARASERTLRGDEVGANSAFVAAYRHYESILKAGEASAGVEQSAGRVALAAGLLDSALSHFRKAGSLDPGDPSHPLLEANLLLQLGRVPEARQAIDRAVAIDPAEPYARATSAVVLKEEGRVGEALEEIKSARRLARPQDELPLRVAEARLRRQIGDPQAALDLLLPLPAADRANEGVAAEIAESAVALGRPRQAIEAWELQFRSTQDWRSALAAAKVALAANEIDESWRWFRTAELIAPSAPSLRAFYSELRAASRRAPEEAAEPLDGD